MTVLFAVGDGATGNTDSARLAAMVASFKPDAFVYLGDVYESGTAAEFAANYDPSWGKLNKVCWPVCGNHDWPAYHDGYQPYWSGAGRPSDPFHTETIDGWTIFCLNSEYPMTPDSDQYKRISDRLQTASPGRRNIACFHRPRYCSGSHGDATDTDPLWQMLGPRCAIILGGHAHNAQVFKPDPTGCVQVVSGAGGRALYAEIPGDERLQWGKADGYCAARIELYPGALNLSFIDEAGTQLWQTQIDAT